MGYLLGQRHKCKKSELQQGQIVNKSTEDLEGLMTIQSLQVCTQVTKSIIKICEPLPDLAFITVLTKLIKFDIDKPPFRKITLVAGLVTSF